MTDAGRLAELDAGLRTDALAPLWRYAVSTRGKEMRARVLYCAEAAARNGKGAPDERLEIAASAVR